MANQNWVSLLTPGAPAAGAAFTVGASTATLSPVLGSAADTAQVNPPGQYLGWQASMLSRVTARGFVSTAATGGSLTFLLAARVGNAGSTYVTLASTAAITSPAAVNTGIQWKMEGLIRCTAVAASGNTVAAQGEISFGVLAAQTLLTATAQVWVAMPNASGETASAVDTTQVQGLSLRCTGTAASGTVQCTQWLVEALN
jgi:hypothetical protein